MKAAGVPLNIREQASPTNLDFMSQAMGGWVGHMAPHTLDKEGEELVAAFGLIDDTPGSVYGILSDADLPWPTIKLSSGEEVWQFWSQSAPPCKALVATLDDKRRDEFHDAYVEYCEGFRDGGRVAVPRPYLLAFGERR